FVCFFFQAEDGIRSRNVTGVQTCALPIYVFGTLKSQPNPWESADFKIFEAMASEILKSALSQGFGCDFSVPKTYSISQACRAPSSFGEIPLTLVSGATGGVRSNT